MSRSPSRTEAQLPMTATRSLTPPTGTLPCPISVPHFPFSASWDRLLNQPLGLAFLSQDLLLGKPSERHFQTCKALWEPFLGGYQRMWCTQAGHISQKRKTWAAESSSQRRRERTGVLRVLVQGDARTVAGCWAPRAPGPPGASPGRQAQRGIKCL